MKALYIKIVEDTPEVAEWLSQALELSHLEGVSVSSMVDHFEDALLPTAWTDVDVALVDLMLPRVDGLSILMYLCEQHPEIHRFAMTASLELAAAAVPLCEKIFVKAFHTKDLVEALEDL